MQERIEIHKARPIVFSLVACGIISILVVLSYWPTFSGDFILDDIPLVKNNPLITKSPSAIAYLSQEDGVTKEADRGISHTGYYRPIINMTYWMDYQLWGIRASGFRITNVIMHVLNCLILFALVVLLSGDSRTALLITLLFSVHPVHTEAVSWISSRNNILVSIFCLSSLYCFVQGWKKEIYPLILLSALLFAGGLLSKEFALMMIPLFFLYQRLLSEKRYPVRAQLARYAPFFLLALVYLLVRMHALGSLVPPLDSAGIWERIWFSPYIVMMNLRCLLLPFGLHSFILGYPGSLLDWKAVAGFATLGLCGFFLWRNRRNRLVVFGALSFLISLFPVLNILKTSAVTLVSMRWLYFPSTFGLIAILGMKGSWTGIGNRHLVPAIAGCLVLYLGAYSYVLNKELWHSEDTFFRQEVVHFENAFYLGGLAENLSNQGRAGEAEIVFHEAMDRYPEDAKNYLNYAGLLLDIKRPAEALAYLARAEGLFMTNQERGQFFNNMGMAYFGLQRQDDALKSFRKAIVFVPEEPLFWSNLGAAYGSLGEYENSVRILEKGMRMVKNPVSLKKNLAVSYIGMQEYEKAIAILESLPVEERRKESVSRLFSQAHEGMARKNRMQAVERSSVQGEQ